MIPLMFRLGATAVLALGAGMTGGPTGPRQEAPPGPSPAVPPDLAIAVPSSVPGARIERSPVDGMPMLVSTSGVEPPAIRDPAVDRMRMPELPMPPSWR